MSEKSGKSRASLWFIAFACIAPVVASYVAYYVMPPGGHVNFGEMMDAQPLPDPGLHLVDGTPFRLSQLRGKWILLMADSARCDEACQRKLFSVRQLRLTQGREKDRIERVWLVTDADALPDALPDYGGTWLVRAAASELIAQLPARRAVDAYIYLVDPLGNLVLRYDRDAEPRGIIKDLTRLLKASRIG